MDSLLAISPIDGRYRNITEDISQYFSEYAYIKYRVIVELHWLKYFLKNVINQEDDYSEIIEKIVKEFDIKETYKVKEYEKVTNHDVKAIEYYVREKLKENNLEKYNPYVHFACTSEDINNIAYGKMINDFLNQKLYDQIDNLLIRVKDYIYKTSDIPMLAHTHGQPATPTTVGKELAVFVYRWENILKVLKEIKLKGKFSGAVGTYSAHILAYPDVDWINLNKQFVEEEGLEFNYFTTQIESHDLICMLFNNMKLFNNILMDFDNDMWTYISMGYFKQKVVSTETGSSVMPHKVNPINFENSMANIRIANSIFDGLSNNLQISRMQRDLSDSSMLRNIGVAFSHTTISIVQTVKGFEKLETNKELLDTELAENPEVLSEAIQTVLRKNKYNDAYEVLKEFSRGKKHTLGEFKEFIKKLNINEEDKKRLLKLSPKDYIGLSKRLCELI